MRFFGHPKAGTYSVPYSELAWALALVNEKQLVSPEKAFRLGSPALLGVWTNFSETEIAAALTEGGATVVLEAVPYVNETEEQIGIEKANAAEAAAQLRADEEFIAKEKAKADAAARALAAHEEAEALRKKAAEAHAEAERLRAAAKVVEPVLVRIAAEPIKLDADPVFVKDLLDAGFTEDETVKVYADIRTKIGPDATDVVKAQAEFPAVKAAIEPKTKKTYSDYRVTTLAPVPPAASTTTIPPAAAAKN
jgi:hypothetical protein